MGTAWSREAYEGSVTSRCWSCTPADAGWDEGREHGFDVPTSAELRAIFEEEMALGGVPAWAREVVDRMIGQLPMCGHYSFPGPVLDLCRAVREQRCPEFVISHYTASPERKRLLATYIYCLDAWLEGAPPAEAEAELARRDDLGKRWSEIIAAVYTTLGERTPRRAWLVRRLIHRQRWWLKTLIWPGDGRDQFALDAYLGDVRGDAHEYGCYGNPPFGDPYFAELRCAEVRELTAQIREAGDGPLLAHIEHSHLCAPKAFRHLEKTILAIGRVAAEGAPDDDRPILQCEDAYPDFGAFRKWYERFMAALASWLDGDEDALPELGPVTPVGHWLARVLRLKLQLYAEHNPFGRLVGAQPAGRSGTQTI
ncbi:hypothetical protein LLH23_17875 [bacterium]|nr:hypothetical protein [bacterium]